MIYLLFVIITLLIAIVYSIQTRIWQAETYHLEKEFPIGKNKKMDGVINERNKRMGAMIWSMFLSTILISVFIAVVIFGCLFVLEHFNIINFLNK